MAIGTPSGPRAGNGCGAAPARTKPDDGRLGGRRPSAGLADGASSSVSATRAAAESRPRRIRCVTPDQRELLGTFGMALMPSRRR
jgi:hypothetical protein